MTWTEILDTIRDVADRSLFSIAGTPLTLASILTFVLILVVGYWVSHIVQRMVGRWIRTRGVAEEGAVSTTKRLLHYGVMVVAMGVALETIGIDLGALFAAGAVLAVAIGFAMQNILQNFVSGVILLAERSITESDVLEVEGQVVQVERMKTRATVARTRDGEELIIPNSILVQSTVKNYTLADPSYRIRTTVGVTYSSDMRQVFRTLDEAARSVAERSSNRDPIVLLLEFADSSVVFEVSVWAEDPWRARQILSHLNEAIWWGLKDAGITIAFPQMDVHLDPSVSEGLARGGRGREGGAPGSPEDRNGRS